VIGLEFISTILAGLYVGMGAFALFLDRIKGFVSVRWFVLIAFAAAAIRWSVPLLFPSICADYRNLVVPTGSDARRLHSLAWMLVCQFGIASSRSRSQTSILVICAASGLTSLVPGWVCDRVRATDT